MTSRLGTGMSLNFFYSVMWARRALKAERQRCEKGGGAGENGMAKRIRRAMLVEGDAGGTGRASRVRK